ncbi:hypothetical protein [Thermus caldilimi]|uniref:hypothetical protein n=1 Tax=Thermus caldilimi TaxID=2483360 RepID=UPI0010766DBF|nr:hypothetical protein [Thermus caldilimi]
MLYFLGGKTRHQGKRLSETGMKHLALLEGQVYAHPQALCEGTLVPEEDLPAGVTVVVTPNPPKGALVLAPGPKGWVAVE